MRNINIIAMLLFCSCTRDVKVSLPQEANKLVVYCTFNPDSTWKLWLSSTVSIGDYSQQFPAINNAEVVIYENGATIDTLLNSNDGIYTSSSKPQVGNSYSFTANAQGFDGVSGSDSIPLSKGEISRHVLTPNAVPYKTPPPFVGEIWYIQYVKLELTDNITDKNYYQLKASEELTNLNQIPGPPIFDPNWVHFPFKIIATFDERFEPINDQDAVLCYSDKAIDQNVYNLDAYFYVGADVDDHIDDRASFVSDGNFNYFLNGNNGRYTTGYFEPVDSTGPLWEKDYYIELKTISESYYKYIRSRMLQSYNRSIPGSEFNNVYSNIKGGKGIFVGYQSEKKKLDR